MRYRWLILVLFSSLCLGQLSDSGQQKTDPTTHQEAASSTSKVEPNAPVITINGLCDHSISGMETAGPSKPGSANPQKPSMDAQQATPVTGPKCKTVVTRAQFETVVD